MQTPPDDDAETAHDYDVLYEMLDLALEIASLLPPEAELDANPTTPKLVTDIELLERLDDTPHRRMERIIQELRQDLGLEGAPVSLPERA